MPKVQDQFDADGAAGRRTPRTHRFLDEFEWYANALKRARAEGVPY